MIWPSLQGIGTDNSGVPWQIAVELGDRVVPFKLDTGAQITAISEETCRGLQDIDLKKPSTVSYGPALHPLNTIDQFTVTLFYNRRRTKQRVVMVCDLQTNLLGLPAIIALQLLR